MMLKGLTQSPLNATFMGVAHGVLCYYGAGVSDSILYGASGHGFAINIHEELCPSGPYCWDKEPIRSMLGNLGIKMELLGSYSTASTAEERKHVEGMLRIHLDSGHPCALLNMENQLITGYDEKAFRTSQPWPCNDFPPLSLTFTTWEELGDEIHIDFYTFTPVTPQPFIKMVGDSLRYAVSVWREPTNHSSNPYGFGPFAYDNWVNAINAGYGTSHGHWWNATVWSECKKMLRGYFCEVSPVLKDDHLGSSLSKLYGAVGDLLADVSNRDMPQEIKLEKLAKARATEEQAVLRIETYLGCQP